MGKRFHQTELTFTQEEPSPDAVTLNLIPALVQQEILGWGGSFTDASAINVAKLDPGAQDLLLR